MKERGAKNIEELAIKKNNGKMLYSTFFYPILNHKSLVKDLFFKKSHASKV